MSVGLSTQFEELCSTYLFCPSHSAPPGVISINCSTVAFLRSEHAVCRHALLLWCLTWFVLLEKSQIMGAEDASLWLLHVQKHVGDVKVESVSAWTQSLQVCWLNFTLKGGRCGGGKKLGYPNANAKSDLPHTHPAGYMLHATALHHRCITIKQTRIFKKQNFSTKLKPCLHYVSLNVICSASPYILCTPLMVDVCIKYGQRFKS